MMASPDPLRWQRARMLAFEALEQIRRAGEMADPVGQRRAQVNAAKQLREAADLLDDAGRLEA